MAPGMTAGLASPITLTFLSLSVFTGRTPPAGAAVPSPGRILLDSVSTPAHPHAVQVASQTDSPEATSTEVEEIEQDMEDARQRIDALTAPAQPAPAPDPPATAVETAGGAFSAPRHGALREGHGKLYYMVWGIVDWAIAAQLWGVSASALLPSAALTLAVEDGHHDGLGGLTRSQARSLSGGLAAVSLGLGVAGVYAAVRASDNLSTYEEMKAREAGHRAPAK